MDEGVACTHGLTIDTVPQCIIKSPIQTAAPIDIPLRSLFNYGHTTKLYK